MTKQEADQITYPVELRSKSGLQVLFTDPSEGTVTKTGPNPMYELGQYRNDWTFPMTYTIWEVIDAFDYM